MVVQGPSAGGGPLDVHPASIALYHWVVINGGQHVQYFSDGELQCTRMGGESNEQENDNREPTRALFF